MPQGLGYCYLSGVVGCVFAIVGPLALVAQEPALARRLDELVEQARSQHQIPSLSVAVVVNGTRVYAKGFGTASITESKPVTAQTQYRLASVSKAFTAVAILKLAEQGKLELERPARDYCPELKLLNGAPTVRHLLAHQSGLRHTSDDEDTSIRGPMPRLGVALDRVVKERRRFAPGAKTLYSCSRLAGFKRCCRSHRCLPANDRASQRDGRSASRGSARRRTNTTARWKVSTAYLFIVPERRVAVTLLANRERFVPEVYPIVLGAVRAREQVTFGPSPDVSERTDGIVAGVHGHPRTAFTWFADAMSWFACATVSLFPD